MKRLALFLAFALPATNLHAEILPEDLSGSWKITLMDAGAADPATDDGRWSQLQFPDEIGKRISTETGWIWLRRSINIDPLAGTYALRFERLYGEAQVFLAGRPAKRLRRVPGEGALYLLPSADLTGPQVLALRLQIRPGLPAGAEGRLVLSDVQKGLTDYYFADVVPAALALLYTGIGLFFFMLYRSLQNPLYSKAACLYLLLALIGLGKSSFVMAWLPETLTISLLQSLSVLIPACFILLARQLLATDSGILPPLSRLIMPVALLVAAVYFLLQVLRLPAFALWLHHTWFLLLIPVWVLLSLAALRETSQSIQATGIIMLAGVAYFFFAGFLSLVSGDFFRLHFAATTPLYAPAVLMPAAMLFSSLLLSERALQTQGQQLADSEMGRSRLFTYISEALDAPMRATLETLSKKMTVKQRKAVLNQLQEYEGRLDDLLELGRLELLEEPEARLTIPAVEFLQTILPGTGIPHTIHVDDDLLINTSLELVNSALVRLVRFPGFATFDHIDLIVTEDLNERLHFRLLMHHRDRKQLRHIQDIIAERLPDAQGLWIEWNIIRETIRLLDGRLSSRTISGKYLSLDLSLPAFRTEKEKASGPTTLPLTVLPSSEETGTEQQKPSDWKESLLSLKKRLLEKF